MTGIDMARQALLLPNDIIIMRLPMKTFSAVMTLAVAMGAALYAAPSVAANARHPYKNVNPANDKGNSTGDSQVEKLNQQQLDSARSQNGFVVGTPQPMMGAPLSQPGMTR